MKGKRTAAARPEMDLSDDTETTEGVKNTADAPVSEGKEIHEFDHSGEENPEERLGQEYEDENGEEGEDEGEEEVEGEGEGFGGEEEEERPKLDEGFFEIEAIRRKRVRKGQLQYLIKWRGWPETSNTWEPLENLQSCSDVIDAFEERLLSGKSSRKRKRKHWGSNILPKKKQQLSSTGYNITDVEISVDKTFSTPVSNSSLADGHAGSGHDGENNENVSITKTAKQTDENGHTDESKLDKKVHTNGSEQNFDKKEDNEYDPKLSELKGTPPTDDVNTDKVAVHFQEGNSSGRDGFMNVVPKFDYVDPAQNKSCTGAKRRKSGSVKRFQKELAICEPASVQGSPIFSQPSPLNVTVGLDGETAPLGIENGTLFGANSTYKPAGENCENSLVITKIIKPIGFSASVMENTQDVLVSFVALRSDGKEVMVDNKFLKSNNPHLLIDFYEQHLKYST